MGLDGCGGVCCGVGCGVGDSGVGGGVGGGGGGGQTYFMGRYGKLNNFS